MMLRSIQRFDYAWILLSAYLVFICTIRTNGWSFLVGNNSIGFRTGCILAAILSASAIIRVFAGRFSPRAISKVAIVSLGLLLLGTILFWVRVASG
jgi:hypothetical protein